MGEPIPTTPARRTEKKQVKSLSTKTVTALRVMEILVATMIAAVPLAAAAAAAAASAAVVVPVVHSCIVVVAGVGGRAGAGVGVVVVAVVIVVVVVVAVVVVVVAVVVVVVAAAATTAIVVNTDVQVLVRGTSNAMFNSSASSMSDYRAVTRIGRTSPTIYRYQIRTIEPHTIATL